VSNSGWNATIAPGNTVSFGFVAAPGANAGPPSKYTLNGGSTTTPSLPTITIDDAIKAEGNVGSSQMAFAVRLSKAAASPIVVDYVTADGTAKAGADYLAATGRLTFAPGETSKTVAVQLVGDMVVEPTEAFTVKLSGASGATTERGTATGTIQNDDTFPQPGVTVSYKMTSDWGSGFNGEITVTNQSAAAVDGWGLEFDFPGTISSIWDARVVSQSGQRHLVAGAGWNSGIPAMGSVSFGFTASPGGGTVAPGAFAFRSGIGSGTTNRPPVATADAAFTSPGQAVTFSPLANDTDPDSDRLTLSSVSTPTNGTARANSDGSIIYTPRAGFSGADTFTYAIADSRGAKATGQVTVQVRNVTAAQWPERTFAPYIDIGLYPTFNIAEATQAMGVKHVTLAFITADPSSRPAWGGYAEYAVNGGAFDLGVRNQIAALRAAGGDAMVSFGGASGRELAETITDVAALKTAYRSVVDAYNLSAVDFDIEGAAAADRVSVDRRSAALTSLQQELAAEGKSLQIWLTLPVLPTGLTHDGLYVVNSAVRAGVHLAGVNIMTMDYGESAAPNPTGRMGDYAIQAGESLHTQLGTIYGTSKTPAQLYRMIGNTPMIGLNDVTTEVFDQQEAREVVAWAREKGVGRISMWSLNRDFQHPSGRIGYVDLKSSSILQRPYEFSKIFLTYM
jgi:hypothetical protein